MRVEHRPSLSTIKEEEECSICCEPIDIDTVKFLSCACSVHEACLNGVLKEGECRLCSKKDVTVLKSGNLKKLQVILNKHFPLSLQEEKSPAKHVIKPIEETEFFSCGCPPAPQICVDRILINGTCRFCFEKDVTVLKSDNLKRLQENLNKYFPSPPKEARFKIGDTVVRFRLKEK